MRWPSGSSPRGGAFSANAGKDYTVVTVSILSEYVDTAYEYISHLIREATFPEDELEKERKRVKTALELQLSDPNDMADRHFMEVVYGHHPLCHPAHSGNCRSGDAR